MMDRRRFMQGMLCVPATLVASLPTVQAGQSAQLSPDPASAAVEKFSSSAFKDLLGQQFSVTGSDGKECRVRLEEVLEQGSSSRMEQFCVSFQLEQGKLPAAEDIYLLQSEARSFALALQQDAEAQRLTAQFNLLQA